MKNVFLSALEKMKNPRFPTLCPPNAKQQIEIKANESELLINITTYQWKWEYYGFKKSSQSFFD